MQTLTTVAEIRRAVAAARREGARVALVPTMGFLHHGHLTLVDAARERADLVVMSVFVNPLQFGPGEDFERYPRDAEGDAEKARGRGVDVLFAPPREEVYPSAALVHVVPQALDARWEGAVRPGHFAGVLTVVAKLFNIVQPDVAVFGQKDVQQLTIVRAMVRDLDFPVDVVAAPIARDPDGLAMSSRNTYLSADERSRALALSGALRAMSDAFDAGERSTTSLEALGRRVISGAAGVEPDYLAVVDAGTLEPAATASAGNVVIVAARVGRTRLIDNLVLGRS
jgi:pantoate--beta-alanine ligase